MATAARSAKPKSAAKSASVTEAAASGVLTCPECGKTFTRPASLGAHRQRVHGVAGSSQNAQSRRGATRKAAGTRTRGQAKAAAATGTSAGGGAVDHDALLRALFPDGIPPRQETIAAVNDWLAQADSLARQR